MSRVILSLKGRDALLNEYIRISDADEETIKSIREHILGVIISNFNIDEFFSKQVLKKLVDGYKGIVEDISGLELEVYNFSKWLYNEMRIHIPGKKEYILNGVDEDYIVIEAVN